MSITIPEQALLKNIMQQHVDFRFLKCMNGKLKPVRPCMPNSQECWFFYDSNIQRRFSVYSCETNVNVYSFLFFAIFSHENNNSIF